MLFNSYLFILAFLPTALIGFYILANKNHQKLSISWLILSSLLFYSWWNPAYLWLISFSVLFNFYIGRLLLRDNNFYTLCIGVISNLLLLAYFKYGNFFVDNINNILSKNITLDEIILPIAISFFTFQQIAFLVDTYRGETKRTNFLNYCLFVTFFPQLIAGPIVHHSEMLPQFKDKKFLIFQPSNIVIGITIFSIGLFKKSILADGIADYSSPVFEAAEFGNLITFFEAWGGALAYSFQLYFDFSGYSEMAIGLGRMFGIILPINFYSPYKANNIIDFWKRWHITLSRFLQKYLYIPLGGNRKGTSRRYINLLITMFLGGLWHGAGWNFLIWGAIHGFYLVINHSWRYLYSISIIKSLNITRIGIIFSRAITFLAIVFAWVIFRSETLEGAIIFYRGMLGLNGFSLPIQMADQTHYLDLLFPFIQIDANGLGSFGSPLGFIWLGILLWIVWFTPNTIELINDNKFNKKDFRIMASARNRYYWSPTKIWAFLSAFMAVISILSLNEVSEFLYFQF
tara:strand:- start:9483 stop:11027 length:1545 start_codon:yes stop_codon:yes gene_type:complete